VAARRPTHLVDRAWLRRNSHALHAALEAWPGAANPDAAEPLGGT